MELLTPTSRRSSTVTLIPTRLGVRAKLITGAAVLSTMTAVVGVTGIHDMTAANRHADTLVSTAVEPLAQLGTAQSAFNENRALLNAVILEDDAATQVKLQARMAANVKVVDARLAAVDH